MSSLPETQREFQMAVSSLPSIPFNVIGTRDEEKHTEQLMQLRDTWSSKIGTAIENWECSIQYPVNNVRRLTCTPIGMNREYSLIGTTSDPISHPNKVYIGDKLVISGEIETVDINQTYNVIPNAPNGYTLYLKNAVIKIKE